jgi:undecaprenyl-diphosphatase
VWKQAFANPGDTLNDYLLAVLLGVVEGLTEFLPVSSTAHLRISEALLGMDLGDGYWKFFTVFIQLGAILTLPIYFRGRIVHLISNFPKGQSGDRTVMSHPLTLTAMAFVCTAGPAFLLKKLIGKNLEDLMLIASALIVGGILMWVVDAWAAKQPEAGKTKDVERISTFQALWVGCWQVLSAVFPGTSRSMITIAAGEVVQMSRPTALEFSFLLSIPTMVAATGYDLLKAVRPDKTTGAAAIAPTHLDAHAWIVLGIGTVVSFVVAYVVVVWFMGWVRKRGFVPFAIYRIAAGAAVIVWVMSGARG